MTRLKRIVDFWRLARPRPDAFRNNAAAPSTLRKAAVFQSRERNVCEGVSPKYRLYWAAKAAELANPME